eukprot:gene17871-13846_t
MAKHAPPSGHIYGPNTTGNDPACWLTNHPVIGFSHKRWYVLHRSEGLLVGYVRAFIPPSKGNLKQKIDLSHLTDCAAKGSSIHIDLANYRSTIKLSAPDEATAVDWAKMIKLEAHTQGIENPLNLEVQAACQGGLPANSDEDGLYSKYQDFKCAGTDLEPADSGNDGLGVGYMDLPADGSTGYMDLQVGGAGAADGCQGGYMDIPPPTQPSASSSSEMPKFNASGKQRPSRPKRPPRPARPGASPQVAGGGGGADEGPGYMDVKFGGANAVAADGSHGGYMDLQVGGAGAVAADGDGGYMDIPVGGATAGAGFVHMPPPLADSVTTDQAYLDVSIEGADTNGVGASGGAPDAVHYLATTAAEPETVAGE